MYEDLRTYILKNMIHDPGYALEEDEPLITGGLVDSFSLVELSLFIEEQYGVQFPDSELTAANMNTLRQIIANIEAKKG